MTYAGAYSGNERVPVDRLLQREGHPLGVRRDEATAVAVAEAEEAATSSRKWTFGVAAGALLMAGTFAAGALGITGGATPAANTAPEHAPAAPGHGPQGGAPGAPVVGAPAPGQQQDPQQQETKPAAAGPDGATTATPRDGSQVGYPGGGSGGTGGSGGGSAVPAPQQPAPAPAPQPAPPPAPPAQQQGPLGQVVTPVVDTVGDVLSPVTDIVGGILSPLSGGTQSTSQATTQSAPAGPALTMINPLGDLLGG